MSNSAPGSPVVTASPFTTWREISKGVYAKAPIYTTHTLQHIHYTYTAHTLHEGVTEVLAELGACCEGSSTLVGEIRAPPRRVLGTLVGVGAANAPERRGAGEALNLSHAGGEEHHERVERGERRVFFLPANIWNTVLVDRNTAISDCSFCSRWRFVSAMLVSSILVNG
jgi:hypothetical protein